MNLILFESLILLNRKAYLQYQKYAKFHFVAMDLINQKKQIEISHNQSNSKMSIQFFRNSKLLLICTILLISTYTFGQKNITGIVSEKDTNEPLIGATVVVKGSQSNGTVTDIDGKYRISAKNDDILVFSYVGMQAQEVKIDNKSQINVSLGANSKLLDEVVAIGYGVVKKSDLTGSIGVVTAKDLTKNPASSAAQALQGKTPGVLVTQTGQPGAGASIRVRGVGSINNSSEPIYILDGVRVGDINGIQPQDIENFQVLKDASATAIYGANGSNGVIIVNTKRGKSGKAVINLNSYVTYNLKPKAYDVMNANEYADFYLKTKYTGLGTEKTYTDNNAVVSINPAYSLSPAFRKQYYGENWENGTDWQQLVFRNTVSQNHNISVAGGGENSNFNISFAYSNDQGTIIKSAAESYSIRANSDFKLGKHIKIGENLSTRFSITQQPTSIESSVWDLKVSPLMKVYNPYYKGGYESFQTTYFLENDGSLTQNPSNANNPLYYTNTLANDKANPLASIMLGDEKNYASTTNASIYAQIDFTDWLMFKSTPSVAFVNYRNRYWMPRFEGNRATGSAKLSESYFSMLNLNIENQLSFRKKFDKHNVQATFVQTAHREIKNFISGAKTGFNYEDLATLSNGGSGTSAPSLEGGMTDYRETSYLARLIYDYNSTYYLTASTRRDGVSSFAPGYRIGNFSALSLAWKVNEVFFRNYKDLDALKVRIGWGQTGNSQTSGSYYEYYDKITGTTNFSPVFGDDQHVADAQYIFYGKGSPTYHWETSEMTNIGVDLNMFNGKLQSNLEYYIKNVDDLLVRKELQSVYGREEGNPWVNLGSLQNKGLEASVQWRDKIANIDYGISSNFTTITNRVKELVTDVTTSFNRTIVGHSVGSLYGFVSEGIIQSGDPYQTYPKQNGSTPQPGDIKYADLNQDGVINANDKTIIGKTIPSINYSFAIDASYKNFDLNIFLYGVAGYQIYNLQRASMSGMNQQDMMHNKLNEWANNYWTVDNPTKNYVRYDAANTNTNDQISSFWVENGSFLRIKDIQLGYNLPSEICKKLALGNLRIYLNAANVYNFTKYKGRDPESFMSTNPLTSGVDNGGYTLPRSFTAGLQIGF